MIFKIVNKDDLRSLFESFHEEIEFVGPKLVETKADGKPIYHYLPVDSLDELVLDYDTTEYSAKTYFIPYRETLSSYEFKEKDWEQEIKYRIQPRVIFGLHACDINALLKLDVVFAKDFYPNPYYLSRRKNTFTIGIACNTPCKDGFCKSLGMDTVSRGFDLFLTDLGDRYFVKIGSDRAFNALQKIKTQDISEIDKKDYLTTRLRFKEENQTNVSIENLPNLLDIEFESEVWKKWGDKCLSCGSCAMVCPTCYCYGVSERVSMDFESGKKIKQLYSCNLLDFAMVAGGHNFRPNRETRLKYRYYHQHRGFVESFGQPLCVGCNRCGRVCLSGINPPDVINDLQTEYVK